MNNKQRILHLLKQGGKYGTIDFVTQAHVCDPHKSIAALTEKGEPIASEWVKQNGKRFKVWFLKTQSEK